MKTKFTPGPWKQSLPDDTAIYGADGWPVCETGVGQDYDEHFARMEADARLIAAAPELFEAAEAAMQCIGELPPTQARVEVAQMLQAALAKATGEKA